MQTRYETYFGVGDATHRTYSNEELCIIIDSKVRQARAVSSNKRLTWDDAIVPYVIDNSIGKLESRLLLLLLFLLLLHFLLLLSQGCFMDCQLTLHSVDILSPLPLILSVTYH